MPQPMTRMATTTVTAIDSALVDGTRAYFNLAAATGLLKADEEHQLALLLKEPKGSSLYEHARTTLIEKNLLLVINVAKRYANRGVDLDDLISEGNLGLIRAVEKFDADKVTTEGTPIRFSTYAIWWIRQAIAQSIPEQGRAIRLPSHIADLLRKIDRATEGLRDTLGREPAPEEVARELGVPVTDVLDLALHLAPVASLDRPIESSEETLTLADQVEDPRANPLAQAENISSIELHNLFKAAGLTARERQILKLRFGLRDGRERTLEQVGHEFDLTRERVRQIEKQAITKLSRVDKATLVELGIEHTKPLTGTSHGKAA